MAPALPDTLPDNPLEWAEAWLAEATAQSVQRNPNSMTVVTVDDDGQPSARVVLCKEFIVDPGYLVFYTNYDSRKIAELRSNPRVAACFHWDAIGRQIRIEGLAALSPEAESDAYFKTRDWGSQIGAWGSDQSAPLESREALRAQVRERAQQLGVDISDDLQSISDDQRVEIPRPPHWGGVRIWPERVELWVEGSDRIHDRGEWQRTLEPAGEHAFEPGPWDSTRLQP